MEKKDMEKNFQYFLKNVKTFGAEYKGKFIVIVDCEVKGAYEKYEDALMFAIENFGLGNFLIQKADKDPKSYTLYLNRFNVVM